MTASKAGEFKIEVWDSGHPIWCVLHYDGEKQAQFNSNELSDLIYVATKALDDVRRQEEAAKR